MSREQRSWAWAFGLAAAGVLPLAAPVVWSGVHLALADPVLGVIAPDEQPLSARGLEGPWVMGLTLAWFALAYWQRRCAAWEAALVVLGLAAALLRAGNGWLDAAAMFAPLARQLSTIRLQAALSMPCVVVGLTATAAALAVTRPLQLPIAASDAASALSSPGEVFADWRWAPELQRRLGPDRPVLASAGMLSASAEFKLDYLRATQGHARWAELLDRWKVDLLVLESSDQQRPLAGLVRESSDWQVLYDAADALVARRVAR